MSTLRYAQQQLLQKKRQLDQSLERGESAVDHGRTLEKNSHSNVGKLVTTLSCGTIFPDIISDSLDEQTVHNSFTSRTGVSTCIEGYEEKQSTRSYSAPSIVDLVSPLVVIDGSIHDGSDSWGPQEMASQNQPPEDPSNEVDASDISDADEESNATVRRRVFSHLYLDDEYPPRPVVPIGPGFQAEIPKWEVTNTENNYNSLESLKYSGTPVWPIEDGINEAPVGSIGQERHEFCSCESPGSAN